MLSPLSMRELIMVVPFDSCYYFEYLISFPKKDFGVGNLSCTPVSAQLLLMCDVKAKPCDRLQEEYHREAASDSVRKNTILNSNLLSDADALGLC